MTVEGIIVYAGLVLLGVFGWMLLRAPRAEKRGPGPRHEQLR